MMIFTCQAILFDMDGVLIDSTAAVARVWHKWAIEHQRDPEYVIDMAHGRRSVETLRIVAPELNAEQENMQVENLEILDKEGVKVVPGAPELLRSLPRERFTIVTSATRPLAEARLPYAGIPVPERFITANDVAHGKPHPEPYLKGAALLGFPPEECIVFEDTPAGIGAAKKAGMRAIGLTTTYPAAELAQADAIVASCADVKASFRGGLIKLEVQRISVTAHNLSHKHS